MEKINWEYIYRGKRDNYLPDPLPYWSIDPKENVHLTLEWLSRYYRALNYVDAKGEQVNFMTREDNILERVKDNWFTQLWVPGGMFYHVCDTKALLMFRRNYESIFMDTHRFESIAQFRYNWKDQLKRHWNNCWSVVGRDGVMEHWVSSNNIEELLASKEHEVKYTGIDKFLVNGIGYRYKCSKCLEPMPKGVQAWTKLNAMKTKFTSQG